MIYSVLGFRASENSFTIQECVLYSHERITFSPCCPQWCSGLKCVTMGERPAAIHGSWGAWSEWSPCSRTCGAGVEFAHRHCDNPAPANGGRYCTGDRKKYRICNTQVSCDTMGWNLYSRRLPHIHYHLLVSDIYTYSL